MIILNFTIEYQNSKYNYHGISISKEYLNDHFSKEIRDKIYDISGTIEITKEDVDRTGFEPDFLISIYSLEQKGDVETWRIGEAIAELFLEHYISARFH